MNREIKFRAKATENLNRPKVKEGDWIYGYSLRQYDSNRIEIDGIYSDPDTFGQYTCLKDRNGKDIYEGDIIAWDKSAEYIGLVFFSGGDFLVSYQGYRERETDYLSAIVNIRWVNVVGNIYDNLELLTNK